MLTRPHLQELGFPLLMRGESPSRSSRPEEAADCKLTYCAATIIYEALEYKDVFKI